MIYLPPLFEDLKNTNVIRVTGSYADQTNTTESDIDFYVQQDRPDATKRNIDKVKIVLAKYGIKWESTRSGYLFTHREIGNDLSVNLEFSDCFKPRKNRKKHVEISGVMFKTW